MAKRIPFLVSARTARLIGQENFSNMQGAIIELLKNSYDADATVSLVVFDEIDENGKYQKLYILDNWHWMTADTVTNKWMKIGTDDKLFDFISKSWRIKSWAKWIGRFALDRLWGMTQMHTVSKENSEALRWNVNWEDFDNSGSISTIGADLEELNNFDFKKYLSEKFTWSKKLQQIINEHDFSYWTLLEMWNLRDDWSDNLEKLFNDLEVLSPPAEQPAISIYMFDRTNEDNFWRIKGAYYDDYDYKVSIKYLADSEKKIIVEIDRNEIDEEKLLNSYYSEIFKLDMLTKHDIKLTDFKKSKREITLYDLKWFSNVKTELLNKLWAFDFSFYFLKNKPWNDDESKKYPFRNFNSKERTNWLKRFWGVKVFRDNFRVRPYGENGNDWLKLGERQGKSPQWVAQRLGDYRIRPNQISGTINLSRLDNEYLSDKSSREWMVENEVFELFKIILIELIGIFENDRNRINVALSNTYDKYNPKETVKKKATKLAEKHLKEDSDTNNTKDEDSEKEQPEAESNDTWETEADILSKWVNVLNEELEEKKVEISLLRSLASTWLIMSSFAHELKNIKNTIKPRSKNLEKSIEKFIQREELTNISKYENPYFLIELMYKDDSKLENWINYILTSMRKDKRSLKTVNTRLYFESFQDTWENILSNLRITMEIVPIHEDLFVKIFESDMDSIFNNLVANSIKHLAKKSQDKKISIKISETADKFVMIEFEDNGSWLSNEFLKDPTEIFNPFVTSERDIKWNIIGTWLWLFIAESAVKDYPGSKIHVSKVAGWFGLQIIFPKSI